MYVVMVSVLFAHLLSGWSCLLHCSLALGFGLGLGLELPALGLVVPVAL